MKFQILKKELFYNKYSLITWTSIFVAIMIMYMGIYPSFADNIAEMEMFMETMPKEFLQMFNMDQLSMANPLGYFGTESMFFYLIFAGIFSITNASNVLSKEEDEKTIEFLLSKPVSRTNILINKFIYHFIYITVFMVINTLAVMLIVKLLIDGFDFNNFYKLMFSLYLVLLSLGGVGFLFGLLKLSSKLISSIGIGFVTASFFFDSFANIIEQTEFLKYFSLFRLLDIVEIVNHGNIEILNVIGLLVIYFGSLTITYVLYNRRNITL